MATEIFVKINPFFFSQTFSSRCVSLDCVYFSDFEFFFFFPFQIKKDGKQITSFCETFLNLMKAHLLPSTLPKKEKSDETRKTPANSKFSESKYQILNVSTANYFIFPLLLFLLLFFAASLIIKS